MAYDVFISYSSRDKPIADGICANLEAAGVRCWIAPRDIQAGKDWPTEISMAIPKCRAMVLVFSAHSNDSADVSRELILAANNKLVIIPFKIDQVTPKPGMDYYLARTHWLDAMNPPTREQILKLVETVINSLGLEGLAPAPFIPVLPYENKKTLESQKKKKIKSRWIWIGIPLLVLLAVGVCSGGIYLGKKLLAENPFSPAPTLERMTLENTSAPTLPFMPPGTSPTPGMMPAVPTPAPASGIPNATSTTGPLPTAASNLPSINVHATAGTILEVTGDHVAYSPDGKWLIIGERQIHFYDPKSLKEIRSIQANRWVNGLAISPDSKVLAAIDESRGVMLFDLATGSELRTLQRTIMDTSAVNSSFLAFSSDSQTLAVVVGDAIKLFDVATGQDKGTLVARGTSAMVFSPDGKSLYACGWSGITALDIASGSQLRKFGDSPIGAVRLALSPDGSLLVTGGSFDEPMVLWEAATGRQVRTFTGHKGGITSLAFSPDGKLLASSAGDVTIKLWDVGTGNLLQTLVGHTEAASSVAFSPDGASLASIGYNQGVWLWGVTGK